MLEQLIINGIDLAVDGAGSVPSGSMIKVTPVWASEVVMMLSGKQRTFRAPQPAAFVVAINAPAQFAISLAVKRTLEAAVNAFGLVTIVETLSDPGVSRTWTGLLDGDLTLTELEGSNRELYTYALTIRQEAP